MVNSNIKIHFLGAAGTVTGSKYLLEIADKKILIDCGLFQGLKELRLMNWDYLPVHAGKIDMVLLTHGHLDHVGYIPRLVKTGFRGKVLGTAPTLNIAEIILRDSAKIQEEEAKKANEEGYSSHSPAEALYTIVEAEKAINYFSEVEEGEWYPLFENVKARFQYVGHIIGATFIELDIDGKRFVFSGDVGRTADLLMKPPKKPTKADVLFIESTYGDRLHVEEDLEKKLQNIITSTVEKGGTLIIPSFAVERTQTIMYILWQLRLKGLIPDIPMVMDSPMGANVLDIFQAYHGWHQLSLSDCTEMCSAFQVVEDYRETWEVIDNKKSKIVIAGSGMVTGGRVLTYLQQYIGKKETTVLLVGYQAEGTRGRKLMEGVESLKIYGKHYPVKATIDNIQSLSAHADQNELLDWLSDIKEAPKRTFIVHGESDAAAIFKQKIKKHFGWDAQVPELYAIEEINLKG